MDVTNSARFSQGLERFQLLEIEAAPDDGEAGHVGEQCRPAGQLRDTSGIAKRSEHSEAQRSIAKHSEA